MGDLHYSAGAAQAHALARERLVHPRGLGAGDSAQHGVRTKLVSSTRHTSSSKSMPAARAAIGTRL